MATYELTVNGRKQTVTADPGTPLLWVLRDDLKMTGTKRSCRGSCNERRFGQSS
jgi:isoquinoline 1-oxidoreductase alpha subunit